MEGQSIPNPDLYFKSVVKLSRNADKLRQKEDEEEAKLIEYLPVNERFDLDKENKVLTRWQERQRDWEKVETAIGRKLKNKISRPLMMATTDEYRARLEEYDLIQAAIPLKDRFANSAWQMSLRGGGPIRVTIGHMFSGLECEVKEFSIKPKMVRKPKSASATWKNDTFLEQTEALQKKRKKYEKTIHEIRPHTISYQDAGNIAITGFNLFQWAKESSQSFLSAQKHMLEESAYLAEMERALEREKLASSHSSFSKKENKGTPKLEFLSSQDILFQTTNADINMKAIIFKNISNITLYYRWKRIDHPFTAHGPTIVGNGGNDPAKRRDSSASNPYTMMENQLQSKGIHTIFNEKQRFVEDNVDLRGRLITQQRNCFSCLKEYGEILPNEVISSQFVFQSKAGFGVYHNLWVLDILPESTHIFRNEFQQESPEDILHGSISVHLHGHCITYDEHVYQRKMVTDVLGQHTLNTYMRDILIQIIDMIRTPIREYDINQRKITLFLERNKRIFESKFNQFHNTSSNLSLQIIPTKVTLSRVGTFEHYTNDTYHLTEQIMREYEALVKVYIEQQHICYELLPTTFPAPIPYTNLICAHDLILQEHVRGQLKDQLFPEMKIETFDEITDEMITPTWNFDIQTPLTALENIRTVVFEIDRLEKELVTMKLLEEKARAKAARRAAKIAAIEEISDYEDDDDEDPLQALEDSDEEEEEEPEEEDEEEAKKIKPKHRFLAAVDQLHGIIESDIQALLTVPLPEKAVYDTFYESICEAVDEIVDSYEHALKEAELYDYYKHHGEKIEIPPLMNPFTEEGKIHWEKNIMSLTSPVPEAAVPAKGGKAAKGKDNVPAAPQPQQFDYFQKQFYLQVFEKFLTANDHAREKFRNNYFQTLSTVIPPAIVAAEGRRTRNTKEIDWSKENVDPIEQLNMTKLSKSLPKVATYRAEDIDQRVVYYNITADIFMNTNANANNASKNKAFTSAYPIHSVAQQSLTTEIVELVKANSKAIVLVFESNHSQATSFSIAAQFPTLQQSVNQSYQLYKEKDLKAFQRQYRLQQKQLKILTKKLRKQKYANNTQLKQEFDYLSNCKDSKSYKSLDYHVITSYAQGNYVLDQILRNGNALAAKDKNAYYDNYIPILCVENIHYQGVIPKQPEYHPYESDDESCTIPIGKTEFLSAHFDHFQGHKPARIELPITIPATFQVLSNTAAKSTMTMKVKQSCYCDSTSALEEFFTIGSYQQDTCIWLESNVNALFAHYSFPSAEDANRLVKNACYHMKASIVTSRFSSHVLRENLLWIGSLLSLPYYQHILNDAAAAAAEKAAIAAATAVEAESSDPTEPEVNNDLNATMTSVPPSAVPKKKENKSPAGQQVKIESTVQQWADFLTYYYPLPQAQSRLPNVVFVLGGEIKLEKFRFLDDLVSLVDSLYIVGEMAVPFLALSENYSFLSYRDSTPAYAKLCKHILKKARLLGCTIHLPTDIVLAEDRIPENAKEKAYGKTSPENRSDGADYEGDTKVINLTALPTLPAPNHAPAGTTPTVLRDLQGYVYDLGPDTCAHLTATIAAADGTIVWGLPSVVELNACQAGTQALIQAVALKPSDIPIISAEAKKVAVIWGDSTVEWFARILDSDGEFQGDLVSGGYVSYMNRNAVSLYSIVGSFVSQTLAEEQGMQYREGQVGEWIFSRKKYEDEEEEEDEDE